MSETNTNPNIIDLGNLADIPPVELIPTGTQLLKVISITKKETAGKEGKAKRPYQLVCLAKYEENPGEDGKDYETILHSLYQPIPQDPTNTVKIMRRKFAEFIQACGVELPDGEFNLNDLTKNAIVNANVIGTVDPKGNERREIAAFLIPSQG